MQLKRLKLQLGGALSRLTSDVRTACQAHNSVQMTSLKATWLQGTHTRSWIFLDLTMISVENRGDSSVYGTGQSITSDMG